MTVTAQIVKYILDNLPRVIGAIVVATLAALATWLINRLSRRNNKTASGDAALSEVAGSWHAADYFADLIRRASTLSFGDPASWSAVSRGDKEGLITLEQIWTPLRVADSQSRVGK